MFWWFGSGFGSGFRWRRWWWGEISVKVDERWWWQWWYFWEIKIVLLWVLNHSIFISNFLLIGMQCTSESGSLPIWTSSCSPPSTDIQLLLRPSLNACFAISFEVEQLFLWWVKCCSYVKPAPHMQECCIEVPCWDTMGTMNNSEWVPIMDASG